MKKHNRGDTLIEVMLVIALLSIVAISLFGVMSRGTARLQLALERSQVRAELDGQVNSLRSFRDSYIAEPSSPGGLLWNEVITRASTGTPTFHGDSCNSDGSSDAFFVAINDSTGAVSINNYANLSPESYARPGQGIWLEAFLRSGTDGPGAIDILARACWHAPGGQELLHETSLTRLFDGNAPKSNT